ncbi:MAG TPA: KTSC domain-containing protein [Dongiaceae bacterium]
MKPLTAEELETLRQRLTTRRQVLRAEVAEQLANSDDPRVAGLTAGTFEYAGVTADTWRRFTGASSPWSFFRDNIEEEYPAKRIK